MPWIRLLLVILCATQSIPACASANDEDAYSRVRRFELQLFGHDYPDKPLLARVRHLEIALWGKNHIRWKLPESLSKIESMLQTRKSESAHPESAKAESARDDSPPAGAGDGSPRSDAREDDRVRADNLVDDALHDYQSGNITRALQLFREAIELDPDNGDANFNLGAIAESKNDLIGAERFYGEAVRCCPNDTEFVRACNDIHRRLGKPVVAEARKHSDWEEEEGVSSRPPDDVGQQPDGIVKMVPEPGERAYRWAKSGVGTMVRYALAGAALGAFVNQGMRGGSGMGALYGGLAGAGLGLLRF